MIDVNEALRIVLDSVKEIGSETVDIANALGRTLLEDVVSDDDIPFFDNSAMDGYAVRAEDTVGASRDNPVELSVIEEVPAGSVPSRSVGRGEAIKIMTGAPMPDGADAVVIVEATEERDGKVRIFESVTAGGNVRRKGEDISRSQVVLERGKLLRAQEIGLLGSIGRMKVKVSRVPRVAIISTGDELIECHEPLSQGKVRNSNAYTLRGLVAETGAVPVNIGVLRDNKEELLRGFKEALNCDVVLSSGGVSVGEYDYVKDVFDTLGIKMRFWRVAIKPGKPTAFGMAGDVPVFGLPGNPVSVVVTFHVFVKPALLKMMGRKAVSTPEISAILDEEINYRPGRVGYMGGYARAIDGTYHVVLSGEQGSGILSSMTRANCLIVIPAQTTHLDAGSIVRIRFIDHGGME